MAPMPCDMVRQADGNAILSCALHVVHMSPSNEKQKLVVVVSEFYEIMSNTDNAK